VSGQEGPPLAIEGLGRRYGATLALQQATLVFARGTIHAVLGENGSGKSTLVKLLSGVVAPSEGRIRINGDEVRAASPVSLRRRGVGTVFQEVLIAPDRSVADNVLLGCDFLLRREVPRREREARTAALLARITDRRIDPAARAGALDLPARQLVVIARALALEPRILVLDEVTAALDHAERERVFAFMQAFAAGGGLVLFITHRMDEVTRLADRVTILRSGRVVRTLAREEATVPAMLSLMAPAALADAG
jgi:ABC-type sugar transport system ATPase subunit